MGEKTLYLECYSGISGDMTVAALLDLGVDQKILFQGLESLKVSGYRIEIGRRQKSSIDACDFNVILEQEESLLFEEGEGHPTEHSHNEHSHEHDSSYVHEHNHVHDHNHEHNHSHVQDHNHEQDHSHVQDHNHEYDHSHVQDHNHEQDHSHVQNHNHEYDHSHEHEYSHEQDHSHNNNHSHNHDDHNHDHNHNQDMAQIPHVHSHSHNPHTPHPVSAPRLVLGHHEHRNLYEINEIINQSSISEHAKVIARRIFEIIALAEAKAHAKPLEEVHFHEVGAIDSIVDIVAAAICLDQLGISNVVVSELHEGTGQIKCQHGLLPIPVPAVSNIAAMHQLSLHITNVKGELVTPTGAAIVAAIKTSDTLPKEMRILKIGLGAGKRNYPGASGLLRAMIVEDTSSVNSGTLPTDRMWVLEANIDDCTGEALAYAMELLFQSGAKDVYYTPIYMKKNRPAYLLGIICTEDMIPQLESIIFTHTTTIGIRKHEVLRSILPREKGTVITPHGPAFVKVCYYADQTFFYPEYESVKSLCIKSGLDYMTMYTLIQNLAKEQRK